MKGQVSSGGRNSVAEPAESLGAYGAEQAGALLERAAAAEEADEGHHSADDHQHEERRLVQLGGRLEAHVGLGVHIEKQRRAQDPDAGQLRLVVRWCGSIGNKIEEQTGVWLVN